MKIIVTGGCGFIGSNFVLKMASNESNKLLIIDKLTYASPAQLSELITIILNANRYKSSRLGVRQNLTTKETVSRNIID